MLLFFACVYNICFSFCPPTPSSSLLKKNLIVNCKILISHFRKFNFLGSIVRFMLCCCFFTWDLWMCVCYYLFLLFDNFLWKCECGSFVRRRLSMTFELVGICVRDFVGSVLFCIVGKLYEAFCAKLSLCNRGLMLNNRTKDNRALFYNSEIDFKTKVWK